MLRPHVDPALYRRSGITTNDKSWRALGIDVASVIRDVEDHDVPAGAAVASRDDRSRADGTRVEGAAFRRGSGCGAPDQPGVRGRQRRGKGVMGARHAACPPETSTTGV
jgi:hypothetical protein